MNKLLIVLLAICLVSVHGFVRREAPEAAAVNDNNLEKVSKQITEFANTVKDKIAETFDPETIKEKFNELVDNVSKVAKPAAPASKQD